ncbi:MAG: DUF1109 domain-containing protein [Burkholderiaceae bacterium]|nr:DUF1109 domain-containing protein [Burkholderiaceae bacterium]
MKTDQLIEMLARNAGPAPRALAAKRLAPAAALGLLMSALIAVGALGAIPASLYATPAPWIKLVYCGALALAAAALTARLSRPAAPPRPAQLTTLAVVVIMALVGAASMMSEASGARLQALLGRSWSVCPWSVLVLSLPALVATLWAVRGLAPTRPRQAGFAAGLLAGAVGAGGYALACPESSPAFVALWYTLGILLTGGLGATLGPRVLRW